MTSQPDVASATILRILGKHFTSYQHSELAWSQRVIMKDALNEISALVGFTGDEKAVEDAE